MIKRLLFKTDQSAGNLAECGLSKKTGALGLKGPFWARESPQPGRARRPGLVIANRRRRQLGRPGQAGLTRLREAAGCPGDVYAPKRLGMTNALETNGLCV